MRLDLSHLNTQNKSNTKTAIKDRFSATENQILKRASRTAASTAEQDRDFSRGKQVAKTYVAPVAAAATAVVASRAIIAKSKEYENMLFDANAYGDIRREIEKISGGNPFTSQFHEHERYGTPVVNIRTEPASQNITTAKINFNGNQNTMSGFTRHGYVETPLSLNTEIQRQVFISNAQLQSANFTSNAFTSRGWAAVPAQDQATGKIVGMMFTQNIGNIYNGAGQLAENQKILQAYFDEMGINVNGFASGLSGTQKQMLNLYHQSKSIQRTQHLGKLSKRSIKHSVTNIFMKDMRNTDFGSGYRVLSRTMMPIRIVGRPVANFAKGKTMHHVNMAVARHEKMLLQAKNMGFRTIKELKAINPDAYKMVLKGINASIAKQDVNGLLASRIYQGLTSYLNAGMQNLANNIAANTSSQAISALAAKLSSGTQFMANANSFSALKTQAKAAIKKKAKAKLKNTTRKVANKAFGKEITRRLVAFTQRRLASLRGFKAMLRTIKQAIMNAIRPIISMIAGAFFHIFLVVAIVSIVMFIINSVATQIINYTGFTTIATDDEDAMDNNEQLDVSDAISILSDLHDDYKETIKSAILSNDAVAEPVYDYGSQENYKECISALTVMTMYEYGSAGKKITEEALKQVYEKTHTYEVVLTEFKKNVEKTITEKDEKTGKDVERKVTEEVPFYQNVIHVKIVRDQAVVNQDLYDQVTQETGSSNIPEPEDIPNNNWLECVKNTKQLYASKVGYYKLGGSATISYKGKNINLRTDCSGYVSLCMYFYGLTGSNTKAYDSRGLKGNIKGFTKYNWGGDSKMLQAGDILVYEGHTEIYGGDQTVYNNGGDSSAKNPGAYKKTNYLKDHTPICIQRMNTNLLTRDENESISASSNTDKKNNQKDNNKDKNDTNLSKDNNSSPAANTEPSLSVKYHDAVVPNFSDYKGKKTYMSYKAAPAYRQGQMWKYYTKDNDGFCRVGERYVIAIGSGAIGGSNNKQWAKIVGQYVDLILTNGTVIQCVVGDAKSDAHTDTATHFMTTASHCVSEFLVDSSPRNGGATARKMGDISFYKSSWSAKVSVIRVYDKNVLDGGGYTGISSMGSGIIEAEDTVQMDKNGNEVGGTEALAATLTSYQEKYNNGDFTASYKADSKHIVKSKKNKITSIDYLRYIYAKHGVTLPLTARYMDTCLKKVSSKKKIQGDILLYKIEKNDEISDKNVMALAYIGNGQVTGFVKKGFSISDGTTYEDDQVITLSTSSLKKENKVGWYSVSGIRASKAYGACTNVGFGGWTEDSTLLYTGVYSNSEMWIENATLETHPFAYKGYYEDDFADDTIVTPSKADKNEFINNIKPAAEYAYEKYGILPSLFATLSCQYSNYGSTVLSTKYFNPMKITYRKGCSYDRVPSDVDKNLNNYIQLASYKWCVDAWVEDMKARKPESFFDTLTSISQKDPATLSDNIGGLYEVELRYYLNTSSNEEIEKSLKILESNKFYKWDKECIKNSNK